MYDSAGRVAQASAGTQGEVRTDIYTYEVDDLPQKAVFASGDRVTWTYDTLRRQTQTLYVGASNTAAANKLYVLTAYEDGVSSNTKRKGSTTLISSWTNRLGTKNIQTQDTYTYDSLGNITSITDKDGKQRWYTYDQRVINPLIPTTAWMCESTIHRQLIVEACMQGIMSSTTPAWNVMT